MDVRLDHVVLGLPDLSRAQQVFDGAGVVVESGWRAPDGGPALRLAAPGTVTLVLVEGERLEVALTGTAPTSGEPYEEAWTAPDGTTVTVRGRRDADAHGGVVDPVAWPAPRPDGGAVTSLRLGGAGGGVLDGWLTGRGLQASRFGAGGVRVAQYSLTPPGSSAPTGHTVVDLTVTSSLAQEHRGPRDASALVLDLAVGVPYEVEWAARELGGIDLVVLGDQRRFRGSRLLGAVAEAYARRPGAALSWPDPRPSWPGQEPPESAYSRVTDPERYRVVTDRVDSWLEVLAERGIATVEQVDAGPPGPGRGGSVRTVRGTVPGTVPFTVRVTRLEPDAEGPAADVVVTFLAGEQLLVEIVPDCGCDACDSGSRDLLTVVDDRILQFLQGGPVHATSPWGTKTWNLEGWQGSDDVDRLEAAMAAGDPRVEVLRGEAWL